MTTKDTREDVEKLARLLKDELASGMLLRLLARIETAESDAASLSLALDAEKHCHRKDSEYLLSHAEKDKAATANARADAIEECARVCEKEIDHCYHPATRGSYQLILHEIRKLAALSGGKEAG